MPSSRSCTCRSEDRAVPGHWEGDLIVGLPSSAMGPSWNATTEVTTAAVASHWMTMGSLESRTVPHGPGRGRCPRRHRVFDHHVPGVQLRNVHSTWDQGAEMRSTRGNSESTVCRSTSANPHSRLGYAARTRTQRSAAPVLPQAPLPRHSRDDLDAVRCSWEPPRRPIGWTTPAEADLVFTYAQSNNCEALRRHG